MTLTHNMTDSAGSTIGRKEEVDPEPFREEAEAEQTWKPTIHELLIMIVLSSISFMVSLDACIIVTSLSAIVTDLGGNTTQGFWIGTSYLLANAVTMTSTAALSDIFGRPICLMASLICFSIGTVLCCVAHSIASLLVGRSLQGIGGGGIIVLCLVIFTDIVPLRHRPKWYGTVLGAWALGNCLGPVLGGLIVEHTTWRWIFYVMFPFCGFGLVAVPSLLTLAPPEATMKQKLGRIDWIGGFFFLASASLFLIAISWGGSQYSWGSAETLAPLCIGIVGLGGTWVWESYYAKVPFLRRSLFWRASSVATYFCGAVQGLVIYGQLYYAPFFFESVKGFRPVQTGISLFPVMVTLIPGSIITGALVTHTNNYRYAIVIGWLLTTIGSGLMLMWNANTSTAVWATTEIIVGLGHGAILNAQNFATQAMCKPHEEGAAAAMYAFMRQFGMALGVGIGSSAFQNIMSLKLNWLGLPDSIARNSEAFIEALRDLPDGSQYKTDIIDAYVYGFHGVYGVYVAIAGVAFFVSLLIRQVDMNKRISTQHRLQESRASRVIANLPQVNRSHKLSFLYRGDRNSAATPAQTLDNSANANEHIATPEPTLSRSICDRSTEDAGSNQALGQQPTPEPEQRLSALSAFTRYRIAGGSNSPRTSAGTRTGDRQQETSASTRQDVESRSTTRSEVDSHAGGSGGNGRHLSERSDSFCEQTTIRSESRSGTSTTLTDYRAL